MKNEQVSTHVEPLGRAFASTRAVLVQVQAGQLEAPTPCASWDVRALIEHFTGSARWAAAAISGEEAAGENRAAEAAKVAISSPLLEESVEGAMGILLNITGGHDLGLFEVNEAAEIVQSAADTNSNIIFGAVIDDSMGEDVRVTVIATGFDHGTPPIRQGARGRQPAPDASRRREVSMDDRQRSSLEIRDDEIDIPSFLKDR